MEIYRSGEIGQGSALPGNSSTATLNASATFTGTGVDVSAFGSVTVAVKTDQAGTLYMEFSPDNTNWDSSLSYSVAAATNEVHRLSVTRKYFRVRFTNTSVSNQTYFRLQTLAGDQPPLTSALNSTIQTDSDSLVTRSIIYGQTDGGSFSAVPVTQEGHLEVAIHSPRLPFGSIHTESLTPVFQADGVYGINTAQQFTSTGSGGSTGDVDSMFYCSTGTTSGAYASVQSRKRLRYRPGQGVVLRYTAMFTSPVASSYQLAGAGHAEDGFYFGYQDTSFGILHVKEGKREVRTLTVSTASSTTENVVVTLNGTANNAAVTNSGNVYRTAYEISQASFPGWEAYPIGATVVFVRNSAGTASAGAYSVAGTTIVGSFAQTQAGVASTDTFIAQSSWNGDKLDGTGASGVTLDPTKLNVYQIGIQYLGAGAIVFQIETCGTNANNPDFVVVHTLKNPNSLTKPPISNPSFPFTMTAYSAGSTTNLTVKSASYAGFIEGEKRLHGNRYSYINTSTGVGSGSYTPLFSIQNNRYHSGRVNQSVVNLLSISGALKHTSPCIYYLIYNGTLTGNPNFANYASDSCTSYDTAATGVTFAANEQLIWSGHLGDTGDIDHHFNGGSEEITIQPGDMITLAARSVTGSPSWVTAAINTREDQ